jgi:hypothetical protein
MQGRAALERRALSPLRAPWARTVYWMSLCVRLRRVLPKQHLHVKEGTRREQEPKHLGDLPLFASSLLGASSYPLLGGALDFRTLAFASFSPFLQGSGLN